MTVDILKISKKIMIFSLENIMILSRYISLIYIIENDIFMPTLHYADRPGRTA